MVLGADGEVDQGRQQDGQQQEKQDRFRGNQTALENPRRVGVLQEDGATDGHKAQDEGGPDAQGGEIEADTRDAATVGGRGGTHAEECLEEADRKEQATSKREGGGNEDEPRGRTAGWRWNPNEDQ